MTPRTQSDPQLDAVFHALGDATRRRMLRELSRNEQTVGQLAEPFSMSLAAASKHIKVLEGAGLIEREVQGRVHLCRLSAAPLQDAHAWLSAYESFWSARLDALEALLRADDRKRTASRTASRPTTQPSPRTPAHSRKKKGTRS